MTIVEFAKSHPMQVDRKFDARIDIAIRMLQADYERETKDTDVLKTRDLSQETKQQLLELAGRGTEIHKRHRVYIDVVSQALAVPESEIDLPSWV